MLKNSILINYLNPKSENVDEAYVLISAVKDENNEIFPVEMIVNRYTNELVSIDSLHSINTKKSSAARYAPPPSTADYRTEISVAELLDYVNRYFPDILPEDVLRHYGYTERPDGVIGRSALYQQRDSEGRELSEGQAEFFKDTVLKDGEGRLIPVYHGTESEFYTFDLEKAGKNGRANGYGFYLTPKKSFAQHYGTRVIEAYANLTKPLSLEKKTISRGQFRKLVRDLVDHDVEKYKDDGLTWQDSFISNYVYTYDMTEQAAINETADMIYNGNDNDVDVVFELAIADGMNSDPAGAREFYDVLTPSTGYDGLINGNEIVVFNSNQIKSVDNRNPTEDKDIRLQARDADYMAAVNSGDMETAQKMVDDAAKENGYTVEAWHGTPDGGFTVFDRRKSVIAEKHSVADWFSTNVEMINKYYNVKNSRSQNGNQLYHVYLKIANPFIVDAEGAPWHTIKASTEIAEDIGKRYFDWDMHKWLPNDTFTTEEIALYARRNGYDGIIIKNVKDGSTEENPSDVYATFKPSQIKSADAVTYDDEGNVIPLSERFNPENEDIRYQSRDYDHVQTLEQNEDSYSYIGYDVYDGNNVVASYSINITDGDDYLIVDRIDVADGMQGKGIGSKVLAEICDRYPYKDVYVAPDNEDAKRLYERIGDEVTSGRDYETLLYDDQGYGIYAIDRNKALEFSERKSNKGTRHQSRRDFSDTLDEKEFAAFYQKVAEIKRGEGNAFVRTKSGQYIFAIRNKMVYTDGNWKDPKISKVIIFNDDYEGTIDESRRIIYGAEKRNETGYREALRTIALAFGDEYCIFDYGKDIGSDGGQDRSGERADSGRNSEQAPKRQKEWHFGDDDEETGTVNRQYRSSSMPSDIDILIEASEEAESMAFSDKSKFTAEEKTALAGIRTTLKAIKDEREKRLALYRKADELRTQIGTEAETKFDKQKVKAIVAEYENGFEPKSGKAKAVIALEKEKLANAIREAMGITGKKQSNEINAIAGEAIDRIVSGDVSFGNSDKYIAGDSITDLAEDLADFIKKNATVDVDAREETAREAIRGAKIHINEDLKADFGSDWNNFRKSAMGYLNFVNDTSARSIDDVYSEYANQFPGFFDTENIDPKSQAEQLRDFILFIESRLLWSLFFYAKNQLTSVLCRPSGSLTYEFFCQIFFIGTKGER